MGTFKKGLVLGGLLGAALMWFNTTKKGRELRDEIIDHASEVYTLVKQRVTASDQWNNLTQSKYCALAQDVLDEYSKQHGLGDNVKNMVMKVVKTQWKSVKKNVKKSA